MRTYEMNLVQDLLYKCFSCATRNMFYIHSRCKITAINASSILILKSLFWLTYNVYEMPGLPSKGVPGFTIS